MTNFDDVTPTPSKDDKNKSDSEAQSKAKSPQPAIVINPVPTADRRPSMTRDQMRKNVINEIINSEKVFLGHLKDVIEVYRCITNLKIILSYRTAECPLPQNMPKSLTEACLKNHAQNFHRDF